MPTTFSATGDDYKHTVHTEKVLKLVRVVVRHRTRVPDGRDAVANARDALRISPGWPRCTCRDDAIHDGAIAGVMRAGVGGWVGEWVGR